jgi:hydroxymethylbilane synthase
MGKIIRIGTRESQLAVWQATSVQKLLKKSGVASELVYIKSEGDIDTITPLYALGVTGVFTKALDVSLLDNRIDIAVHSMKDVPVQLAKGLKQAAVLKRGSYKDILVLHPDLDGRSTVVTEHRISLSVAGSKTKDSSWIVPLRENSESGELEKVIIATSSIRRIAQWLNRYPNDKIENLRGNINTRLGKLKESSWHGAVFAEAGLKRINLRPKNAVELDWMLPAPAQGAIMIVCRDNDDYAFESCQAFNHEETALCTKIEREFLNALMGGCSTPISALAKVRNGNVTFKGNIASPDGKDILSTEVRRPLADASIIARTAAASIVSQGGQTIIDRLRNKGLTTNGEV